MLRSKTWLTAAFLLAPQLASAQITVTAPDTTSSISSGISGVLKPSWVGMGIEPSNLLAFLGGHQENKLSSQLLQNLADYTGVPAHMRIGGNTDDTAVYNSSYQGWGFATNPNTDGSPQTASQFGPKYFQSIDYLPKGTPITYNVGMAYNGSDAVDQAVAIVQQAVSTFKNVNLTSVEVGNEPDLYIQNGYRPSDWSISDYGDEWLQRVQAIYSQVLQPAGYPQTFFEAACTATTANYQSFRISNLVGTSIAEANGDYVAGWNQHDYYYYVNVSSYQLTLQELMGLSATYGQFNEWKNQAAQAAVTGKPYYLREMGSVGPNGLQGITDTFGAALWTLNFFLYVSTIGVDSVQMHMLQDSYSSPWQPMANASGHAPFVRPAYYAYAAMAQINGAQCGTQIASLSISNSPSGAANWLAAYGAYAAGKVQSVIVINSWMANSTQRNIPSQQILVDVGTDLAGQTFYLSKLTAAGAEVTSNVTWNGLSYEQSGTGAATNSTTDYSTAIVASNGTLIFDVRNSEAVVANLGSIVGTANNVPDESACSTLSASASTSSSSGFKSTTGFKTDSPLSTYAIAGIAAGGGALVLLILGLTIWLCCRRAKRKKRQNRIANYGDKAALLSNKSAALPAGSIMASKEGYVYKSSGGKNGYVPGAAASHEDISMWAIGNRQHNKTDSGDSFGGMEVKGYDSNGGSLLGSPLLNRNSNPINEGGFMTIPVDPPSRTSTGDQSSQHNSAPHIHPNIFPTANNAERPRFQSNNPYSQPPYYAQSQQNLHPGRAAAPSQTSRLESTGKSRSYSNLQSSVQSDQDVPQRYRHSANAGPGGSYVMPPRQGQMQGQGAGQNLMPDQGRVAGGRPQRPQSDINHGSYEPRDAQFTRSVPASTVGHSMPPTYANLPMPSNESPRRAPRAETVIGHSQGLAQQQQMQQQQRPSGRSRSQPRTPPRAQAGSAAHFGGSMYYDESQLRQPQRASMTNSPYGPRAERSGASRSQEQVASRQRDRDARFRQGFDYSTPSPQANRMSQPVPSSTVGASRDPLSSYYRSNRASYSADHVALNRRDPYDGYAPQ